MTYPLTSESEYPQPPLIGTVDGIPVTNSLEIARYFGKRHDNLLRDLNNLQLSDSFRDLNYIASHYTPEGQTRRYPMYYITRDGFALLAMACFHETDALPRKEVFISAFNEVEKQLQILSEENDADLPKMPQVNIVNGAVVTTSLAIAEYFGRRHDQILESVRTAQSQTPDFFSHQNFLDANYLDKQGKNRPMYHITKDGFIFLVMGFTGKEAAWIKVAYINAFNQMEAQLRQPTLSPVESEQEDWLRKYVALQEKHIALQEKLSKVTDSQQPPRRRRLTDAVIQEILALYQQGYSQTEIARMVGYSPATISLVVRQRRSH
ncbi:MAG: Rha family transcriptional regulator [Thiotrichaceae bacterium]